VLKSVKQLSSPGQRYASCTPRLRSVRDCGLGLVAGIGHGGQSVSHSVTLPCSRDDGNHVFALAFSPDECALF